VKKSKEDKESKKIAADHEKAVKALQKALDKVGKRLGGRSGIMVSTKRIALKEIWICTMSLTICSSKLRKIDGAPNRRKVTLNDALISKRHILVPAASHPAPQRLQRSTGHRHRTPQLANPPHAFYLQKPRSS
jgi:hypothetical protein